MLLRQLRKILKQSRDKPQEKKAREKTSNRLPRRLNIKNNLDWT